jgi:hypothetical protein
MHPVWLHPREVPKQATYRIDDMPLHRFNDAQRDAIVKMYPTTYKISYGEQVRRWDDIVVIKSTDPNAYITANACRINIGEGTFVLYLYLLGVVDVRVFHEGGVVCELRMLPDNIRGALQDICVCFEINGATFGIACDAIVNRLVNVGGDHTDAVALLKKEGVIYDHP